MNAFPALLIDEVKARANIRRMMSKMNSPSAFRPHFKTHQSALTGQWFREAGIQKISVTSPQMAAFFIEHGWRDITIAFPFSRHWMVSLNELSRKAHINILVEDTNVLKEIIAKAERPCGIFIKIDVGSKRTGINPDNLCLINGLTNLLKNCRKVNFKGFLAHAGHTYHVKSPHAIQHIYDAAVKSLSALKTSYLPLFPDIITSWGDTPSCSILPKLTHFDEYRPGNFVYYDLMQYHLGSCDFDAIAVCVKVPIVATHPERLEIVLHGGAIHLSKEYIIIDAEKVYGELVLLRDGRAWQRLPERAYLTSLSQEHGIAKVPAGFFAQIKTGGIIGIVPVHSCLTVHQMLNLY